MNLSERINAERDKLAEENKGFKVQIAHNEIRIQMLDSLQEQQLSTAGKTKQAAKLSPKAVTAVPASYRSRIEAFLKKAQKPCNVHEIMDGIGLGEQQRLRLTIQSTLQRYARKDVWKRGKTPGTFYSPKA